MRKDLHPWQSWQRANCKKKAKPSRNWRKVISQFMYGLRKNRVGIHSIFAFIHMQLKKCTVKNNKV